MVGISASKVNWRVQPTAAIRSGRFNKMHGALCALYVSSLNSASMRNKHHLITLQIWILWGYHVLGATHEAILKPSQARNSFWVKSCTGQDMGQFSAGLSNKAVPSLRNSLTECVKGDGRHSEYFLYSKMSHLTVFVLLWIDETIFDNVTTAIVLPWLKVA